jgi:hypothetical protein
MRLKGLLVLAVAGFCIAGCGSATPRSQTSPEQRRVADLARKCGETEAAVRANVKVFLSTASAHGLHGTSGEATEALDTLVNYAEGHKEAPDCRRLLAILVTIGKHPSRKRVCFPYESGRVCVVPPLKG